MRKTLIGAAIVAAALAGLACQGGGGVSNNPTESEATQSPEESYIENPCYKGTDAALAAPPTDPCDEVSS